MYYHSQKLRNKKSKSYKIYIPLIMTLIFGIMFYYYISDLKNPVDEKDDTIISFDIKSGQSIKDIAISLKEKDLIKNTLYFRYVTKKENLAEKVMAGRFSMSKSQNLKEIVEKLSSPPELSILTIQEGLTIRDIEKKLVSQKLIKEGDLIEAIKNFNGYNYYPYLKEGHPLEGYMYPDTYFFDASTFKVDSVIYKMMDNFEKKLTQKVDGLNETIFEAIEKSERTLNEVIIMASIIEKEVFGKTDRKLVSGILWKRLDNGWTIGADATLLYEKDNNIITQSDLQADSPYNTRKNKGLPPTPICNPSIESIIAAVFPTKSEYWFYLNAKANGETIYAKTNEEHNINRSKYL